MKRNILFVLMLSLLLVFLSCGKEQPVAPETQSESSKLQNFTKAASGDPEILAIMEDINEQLQSMGVGVAVEAIEFFTIGKGRPSSRIHAQPFRWVAGDPNRLAQGDDITYIISGNPPSGVSAGNYEQAVRNSMDTWDAEKALKKVALDERADPGGDITIFDFFLGAGGFGNPFAADIVTAGFFPPGPPFFGPNTLAFSVTFIFTDGAGNPTDINGDNRLDTALNEVYYNAGFNWGINAALPQVDVETVALHENGHSLGVGHFGPPPSAVMNPVYAGINHEPDPADHSGMQAVWGSWPK